MSRFDPDKYINYQKLAENLKIVRERYKYTFTRKTLPFHNLNNLLIQVYSSLLFALSGCSDL